MKNLVIVCFCLILVSCSSKHQLCHNYTNDPLSTASCIIADQNNRIISKSNEDKILIPASTMKILTFIAAIKTLGPDYHFSTKLYQLKGQKVGIIMAGDPTIQDEDFIKLLKQIPKNTKEIIIASSLEEVIPTPSGYMVDDTKFKYGAAIDAYMLNTNVLTAELKPARQAGQKAILMHQKNYTKDMVNSEIITLNKCRAEDGPALTLPSNDKYLLRGCIGKNSSTFALKMAIRNPKEVIRRIIKQHNPQLKVTFSKFIPTKLIAEYNSPPLSKMLLKVMEDSDNVFTNRIYWAFIHKQNPTIMYWEEAGLLLKDWIAKTYNINLANSNIHDGAGLARYNKLSAKQLSNILMAAYNDPEVRPHLLTSFARMGTSGTLKERMKDVKGAEKILAKTGSYSDVRCIVGFIDKGQYSYYFTLMKNNVPAGNYKQAIDQENKLLMKMLAN